MSKTMVALASEQRMQNIIPVFQRGTGVTEVLLVRSTDADQPQSRLALALSHTLEALRERGVDAESEGPGVDAYMVEDTRRVVLEIVHRAAPARTVINFTGGTKCMSIGAFLAAREVGATALYVDTANERLIWFSSDGGVREESFALSLDVETYLRTYGRSVDRERTNKQALPPEAFDLARSLLGLWPECVSTLDRFGDAQSQGLQLVESKGLNSQVTALLQEFGFISAEGDRWKITPQGKRVLNKGKWLEAMGYVLLSDSGYFDDVRVNVCLRDIDNELDVIVSRNGKLAFLECKSGRLGGTTELNRLQSICSTLGTFARGFFVASADQVPRHVEARAKGYGIRKVITREGFLQLAEVVRDGMRGGP